MLSLPPLFEHQKVAISSWVFDTALLSRVKAALNVAADSSRLLSFDGTTITTNSHVGVVVIDELCIQVLPKLLNYESNGMSHLLSNLTYLLSISAGDDSELDPYPSVSQFDLDFFDSLAFQFGSLLLRALRRQPLLQYINTEDNRTKPIGRILVGQTLLKNYTNAAKTYCSFDELTSDNPILQTLRFVAEKMSALVKVDSTKSLLDDSLRMMGGLRSQCAGSAILSQATLGRQWAKYQLPWHIALLFIKSLGPNLSGEGSSPLTIEFDMNKLFERYVEHLCNKYSSTLGLKSIRAQDRTSLYNDVFCLHTNAHVKEPDRTSIIDLVVVTQEGVEIIFDVKYKIVNPGDETTADIDMSDLYQLGMYSRLRRNNQDDAQVALIYPQDKNPFAMKLTNTGKDINWMALSLNLHHNLRTSELLVIENIKLTLYFMRRK